MPERAVVRFNDVTAGYAELRSEIDEALAQIINVGDFINGRAVKEFEAAFAEYCSAGYCVGVASGTAALHVALAASRLEAGGEVITSPMTFIATAEAIMHAGGVVRFADVDAHTWNLAPEAVSEALTPNTAGVIHVYLHGNPAGGDEIGELVQRAGLLLVEDCAQAHGARLPHAEHTRQPGTIGRAAGFSFFPAKNLGAFGDAGALVTNDKDVAHRAQMLANHGRTDKYLHQFEGYNYRLDTLQAAVLMAKLARLDEQVQRRNQVCDRYIERLRHLELQFQQSPEDSTHARHLFVVQTGERDRLQRHLREMRIETGIHYPIPLHLQPAYGHLGYKKGEFPNAEKLAEMSLSLPLYPQLPSDDVDYVCETIGDFFGSQV